MPNLDSGKITADQPAAETGDRTGTVAIIGGGMCGMLTGMLLADDGHRVVVVERDPSTPPSPTEAWDEWDRSSVRQFHMGHFFLPRFRAELQAHLPRVIEAIRAVGALSVNPIAQMPDSFSGGWQDGDERFEAVTGRRPVVEAVVAACAADTPGLTVRRGVTVARLVTADTADAAPGSPIHITGVATDEGETITADLVVDASGRNSGLPRLLAAAGAPAPVDEGEDSGFVYYGRAFRSADGSLPASFGGGLQAYGSISTLTLAADNGTWQIAFVASGKDRVMRKVRDEEAFNKLWRSYPLVAHWVDGEPISDIEMMANLEDRIRHFVVDGAPVATGLAAVGDSWACTNPSVGRGASLGILHALALRDQLREHPLSPADEPAANIEWSLAWSRRTAETVEPYYRETVRGDQHRLGQIQAAIEDRTYDSDDPTYHFTEAMSGAAAKDPAALRAYLDAFMMHRLVDDLMDDDDLVERVLELGTDAQPGPGPSRTELEALLV